MNRTPLRQRPGLGLMISQMYCPMFFWLFQPLGAGCGHERSSVLGYSTGVWSNQSGGVRPASSTSFSTCARDRSVRRVPDDEPPEVVGTKTIAKGVVAQDVMLGRKIEAPADLVVLTRNAGEIARRAGGALDAAAGVISGNQEVLDRILALYGPTSLIALPIVWLILIDLAYALLDPRIRHQ